MGVFNYQDEFTTSIPPAIIFKAFVLDFENLLPKLLPQVIKSVEIIKGDGGPGTVNLVHFAEGSQFKFVKSRIDGIDKEKFTYSYTVIESDAFGDHKIESVSFELKCEAVAGGGSICKRTGKFHTKGNAQISEEQIKAGKEQFQAMLKAVEAHLLANPGAYN